MLWLLIYAYMAKMLWVVMIQNVVVLYSTQHTSTSISIYYKYTRVVRGKNVYYIRLLDE